MTKKLRKGKVFVDWSQNTERRRRSPSTRCAPSDRPTVSTPLHWDEVEALAGDGDPDYAVFEAADVIERVEEHGDLFAPVLELEQELPGLDKVRPG